MFLFQVNVSSAFSLSVSAVDSDDGDVTVAEMTDIMDGYTFGEAQQLLTIDTNI